MRKLTVVGAVIALALAIPASVSGWQQSLDTEGHQDPDSRARVAPWFHDLPLDPITGLPRGILFLGQDEEGEDDDEEESEDDWDKKDLPLEPTRKVSFTTEEGSWMSVDVSPDGETVLFDLLGDLYTVPLAGGEATRISDGIAWDATPRYSPDGTEIVFVSDRNGGENIWILDLEEEDEDDRFRMLTRGRASNYASPEWTPDGEYIAVSKSGGTFGAQKLWLVHAEQGGNGFQLISQPAQQKQIGAAFGPDGRWVWVSTRNGDWQYNAIFPQYQIAVYDRETGQSFGRSFRYGSAFRPTPSPDGRWLVYGSRHDAQTGLRIRDLESGDERWLAYPVQRDDQESRATRDVLPGMSFTPDSSQLVVSYGGRIWRVPIDGSDPVAVPFQATVELDAGPALDFDYRVDDSAEFEIRQIRDAAPSPDGSRLAFTALDRLYVMDWPDGTAQRLTGGDAIEAQPAWSPDGSEIAYVTWDEEDGGHIFKIGADGGDASQLTTMAGIYTQIAYSPDGERIVAIRGPARSYHEATGAFPAGGSNDLVWIPAGGGDWTLVAPTNGRTAPHFVDDVADRIYMYSRQGLLSIRWDGTDQKVHLMVRGRPFPGGQGPPPPASLVKIAPTGDKVFAYVGNDLYAILAIPYTGGDAPTVSVANPDTAPVPMRKLTDIGGEFPAWSADGNRIHWSIGNAHVVYDLEEADRVEREIEERKKQEADEAEDEEGEADEAGDADEEAEEDEGQEEDDADDSEDEEEDEGYEPDERRVVVMSPRDIPSGVVVLRGARAITMNGDEVIDNADIVVRDNRIEAVGASGTITVPADADVVDVSGKTIVPGYVDTHAHMWPNWGVHKQQVWMYLANLAYGVTATRDPQTATTDVLTYADKVESGELIGPRVYSTGPGVFSGEGWRDADHARDVLKRYSEYYKTNTIKMYMAGNRRVRQWIINAAREQQLMPTTEGGLDLEMNLTLAIDGYPGLEHSLPIYPLYDDVVQLFAQTGITYSPTLIVSYGGPFGESYFYTRENPYEDEKLRRFFPYNELAQRTRRRGAGVDPGPGGWFRDEEFAFEGHAEVIKRMVEAGGKAGVGSHGQIDGIGYHWELWMIASGGMSNHDALRVATLFGAEGIGLEKDLGSIEVGKLADLVVLDANPLDDIRATARIARVMKNGRLYDGDTLAEQWPRQRPVEGMYWLDSYEVTAGAGTR